MALDLLNKLTANAYERSLIDDRRIATASDHPCVFFVLGTSPRRRPAKNKGTILRQLCERCG